MWLTFRLIKHQTNFKYRENLVKSPVELFKHKIGRKAEASLGWNNHKGKAWWPRSDWWWMWLKHIIYSLALNKVSKKKKQTKNRDNSPLREERVDDSVSQRIDGQLWDPLEIFPTANRRRHHNSGFRHSVFYQIKLKELTTASHSERKTGSQKKMFGIWK